MLELEERLGFIRARIIRAAERALSACAHIIHNMKHEQPEPEPSTASPWRRWLSQYLPLLAASRADLSSLLPHLQRRGIIDDDEHRIISGALRVSNMRVRDIMIASAQMVAIDSRLTPAEIIDIVVQSSHSRFPVIDHGHNQVLGLLLAKDLLPYLIKQSWDDFDMKNIMRDLSIVPESKKLDTMLEDFRRKRIHMAAVVDEHNDISGIITIEDVLEQIVGDIDDEYDKRETSSQYLSSVPGRQSTYLVRADMPLELFNEHFAANFNTDEHDTISGVVLAAMQRLPQVGDEITLERWSFSVSAANERKIIELQITPA